METLILKLNALAEELVPSIPSRILATTHKVSNKKNKSEVLEGKKWELCPVALL
jgi:hypothetical protein